MFSVFDHLSGFCSVLLTYSISFFLGGLIGLERQIHQRIAGLRTNILVVLATTSFVNLCMRMGSTTDAIRVIASVVSGTGFLGAGVIMKDGMNVRGLNTAATIWCSAAVGTCVGIGQYAVAALLTFFVISGNTLLRPLVKWINHLPISKSEPDTSYYLTVTLKKNDHSKIQKRIFDKIDSLQYQVNSVELEKHDAEYFEMTIHLGHNVSDTQALSNLAIEIEGWENIQHVAWNSDL
ncbi:MAG: MgtC/SapB family protein [Zymomonas mobilis]|uniref:Protein MgtC n=1 Tax=Zymomonas mobilis TaxID=542 RepID=A0A542W052_ZYMMB|nr:MgtC/SapB family protein [Zymomonas mobilis]TQL16962.1 putative Mg2+ transporter-C (MgtC) family protein [Zymomonas mobilis]